jgi:3-isopropylmalate dehydrogenase
MMLDHIDEKETANKIRKAIAEVIEEGKVKTYDMMKIRGGADVFEKGACTTQEMTDAVIAKL